MPKPHLFTNKHQGLITCVYDYEDLSIESGETSSRSANSGESLGRVLSFDTSVDGEIILGIENGDEAFLQMVYDQINALLFSQDQTTGVTPDPHDRVANDGDGAACPVHYA